MSRLLISPQMFVSVVRIYKGSFTLTESIKESEGDTTEPIDL